MQALLANNVDLALWRGPSVIRDKQSLSQQLKERREDTGLKQGQIGALVGKDQTTVSLYEKQSAKLKAQGVDFALRFVRAYGFTEAEALGMVKELFSDVLEQLKLRPTGREALERFSVSEDWVVFNVYTSASAGTGEPEITEGEVISIPRRHLAARGITDANRHEVMALKVNGDCLVSQSVRYSSRSISHGDYVFVHVGAPADASDIVCMFDKGDDQLILKFVSEQQDPSHPDIITLLDARGMQYPRNVADLVYRGVVFWRSGSL